jgi:hypothetical protein
MKVATHQVAAVGREVGGSCARSMLQKSLSSVFCVPARTTFAKAREHWGNVGGSESRTTRTFGSNPCRGGTGVPDQNDSKSFCSASGERRGWNERNRSAQYCSRSSVKDRTVLQNQVMTCDDRWKPYTQTWTDCEHGTETVCKIHAQTSYLQCVCSSLRSSASGPISSLKRKTHTATMSAQIDQTRHTSSQKNRSPARSLSTENLTSADRRLRGSPARS